VHVLDDVHQEMAGGDKPRIEHGAGDGNSEAGEPPSPPIANLHDRDEEGGDHGRGNRAPDDQLKVRRERCEESGAKIADKRRRHDHGRSGGDRDGEAPALEGRRSHLG